MTFAGVSIFKYPSFQFQKFPLITSNKYSEVITEEERMISQHNVYLTQEKINCLINQTLNIRWKLTTKRARNSQNQQRSENQGDVVQTQKASSLASKIKMQIFLKHYDFQDSCTNFFPLEQFVSCYCKKAQNLQAFRSKTFDELLAHVKRANLAKMYEKDEAQTKEKNSEQEDQEKSRLFIKFKFTKNQAKNYNQNRFNFKSLIQLEKIKITANAQFKRMENAFREDL